jgi:hypothetical protein
MPVEVVVSHDGIVRSHSPEKYYADRRALKGTIHSTEFLNNTGAAATLMTM